MSKASRREKLQHSARNSADWTSPVRRSVELLNCSTRNWMPGGTASWTRVQYLVRDTRYEKVRVDGSVRDCSVLVAIGILPDGHRSVLGVSCSLSEAEVHWRSFLENLLTRGLKRDHCIVRDQHSGPQAAGSLYCLRFLGNDAGFT
jgi:hypothetical protein